LLDTACSRIAIGQNSVPPAVEEVRRRASMIETEQRRLQAEEAAGADHADRLKLLKEELAQAADEEARLKERWEKEKELVAQIRDARAALRGASAPAAGAKKPVEPTPPVDRTELRDRLLGLEKELTTLQGETPLVQPYVDGQTVASVVHAWTGIPVGRMLADEIQTVLQLDKLLGARIIGQDHALLSVARRIQTSRASLDDPRKPVGVFMFVGPSGVGKTETAIALSDVLYGGERSLITINMSEYQEAHTVSGLKGSPPGYVGYGEGGVLTEAVRRKPYSVVLLDEVEKAHPDVMELFFQVFDKGVLEDGEGRQIDFKNTVLLLTSNVATDQVMSLCADPATRPEPEVLAEAIRPELEKKFPAALLGRLVVTPFYPIADDVMRKIIRLKLGRIAKRLEENHAIPLKYGDELVEAVAARCREVSSGARNVDNILTNNLLPELSGVLLSAMAEGRKVSSAYAGVDEKSQFSYRIE
jgi:type VI secretion system protein VasG